MWNVFWLYNLSMRLRYSRDAMVPYTKTSLKKSFGSTTHHKSWTQAVNEGCETNHQKTAVSESRANGQPLTLTPAGTMNYM